MKSSAQASTCSSSSPLNSANNSCIPIEILISWSQDRCNCIEKMRRSWRCGELISLQQWVPETVHTNRSKIECRVSPSWLQSRQICAWGKGIGRMSCSSYCQRPRTSYWGARPTRGVKLVVQRRLLGYVFRNVMISDSTSLRVDFTEWSIRIHSHALHL